MRRIIAAIILTAALFQGAALADNVARDRVKFPAGSDGTTIRGQVKGYDTHEYIVGAKAGQTLTVALKTKNTSTYYNIFAPGDAPGASEALFRSDVSDGDFRGVLKESGDYTIQVYLYRNAARRGDSAAYKLSIHIPVGSAEQEGAAPDDALVQGTKFHATGRIPCRLDGQPEVKDCAFGVTRGGNGKGKVFITLPNEFVRVLNFNRGKVSPEGNATGFAYSHEGDETEVTVNGQDEFYIIPDAVIYGG